MVFVWGGYCMDLVKTFRRNVGNFLVNSKICGEDIYSYSFIPLVMVKTYIARTIVILYGTIFTYFYLPVPKKCCIEFLITQMHYHYFYTTTTY